MHDGRAMSHKLKNNFHWKFPSTHSVNTDRERFILRECENVILLFLFSLYSLVYVNRIYIYSKRRMMNQKFAELVASVGILLSVLEKMSTIYISRSTTSLEIINKSSSLGYKWKDVGWLRNCLENPFNNNYYFRTSSLPSSFI